MSRRKIGFTPLLLIVAILFAAARMSAQTATEDSQSLVSYQELQEKPCREQPISEPRSYSFRTLPRETVKAGAYGAKPWYRKLFPFLAPPQDKYGVDDIRTLKSKYGRPPAVGESKRSKEIRLGAEKMLGEQQKMAEANWQEWLRLHPDASDEEKRKAETRIRFQGLAATRLSRFDWREYGLDVGAVGNQGFSCNTCWAFATVDAAQISRQLAAMRSQTNQIYDGLKPSARQMISCVIPKAEDYCKINWHGEAFTFMVDKGLPLGGTRRYVSDNSGYICDAETYIKALTWDFVSASPQKVVSTDELKRALVVYGPIVSMISFDNCLWLYGSGVFNEQQYRDGSHMILIIGWDDQKGAWLIKNSYGTGWGEGGFGWIKFGSNNIGQWSAWVVADPKEEKRVAATAPKTAN